MVVYWNLNIIFRPHPANREEQITLDIEKLFKNEENFNIDISNDYYNTYINSMCLITDISGTAYTYAFLTKKPVIFFSSHEQLIEDLEYSDLSFFIDREKIGKVVKNLEELTNSIENIKGIEKKKISSNNALEKEIIYLGKSKERIKELIDKIATKK